MGPKRLDVGSVPACSSRETTARQQTSTAASSGCTQLEPAAVSDAPAFKSSWAMSTRCWPNAAIPRGYEPAKVHRACPAAHCHQVGVCFVCEKDMHNTAGCSCLMSWQAIVDFGTRCTDFSTTCQQLHSAHIPFELPADLPQCCCLQP